MVFSCSWAVYFTICAAKYPPGQVMANSCNPMDNPYCSCKLTRQHDGQWVEKCGAIPWEDNYISDNCHMWRYGEDLAPVWGSGSKGELERRILSGGGGSGVGPANGDAAIPHPHA